MLNGLAVGFIKIKFRIVNPTEREKHIDVEGVVDTGAVYTVVSKSHSNP